MIPSLTKRLGVFHNVLRDASLPPEVVRFFAVTSRRALLRSPRKPKVMDISAAFDKKLRAAYALKTINYSMAIRVKLRLESTGRRLPLLDKADDASVQKLVEINVRKLTLIAAGKTSDQVAEEFEYSGEAYQIPSKYLSRGGK